MTRSDRIVLKETYQAAKASADMIQKLIRKTEDEDLAVDLNRQLGKYHSFMRKMRRQMRMEGEHPQQESTLDRAKFWLGVQAETAFNNSSGHIANMVMKENTKGIGKLMQVLHNNGGAQECYCEFANELMDFTESSINQLKYYLKVL